MRNLVKYTIGLIVLIPLSIILIIIGIIVLAFELLGNFIGYVLNSEFSGIDLSHSLTSLVEIMVLWKPMKKLEV